MSFNKCLFKNRNVVIWTRSEEDWEEDNILLENAQLNAFSLPCIKVREIPSSFSIPEHPKTAVVFCSWRSAYFSLKSPGFLKLLTKARFFCFGKKTEKFLKDRGVLVEILDDMRTASEIPPYLNKVLPKETFILLPGPKKRAFDLGRVLENRGFSCLQMDLYETCSSLELSKIEREFLVLHMEGIVFFASPSACEAFVQALNPLENRLSETLKIFALGPTTAKVCSHFFKDVHIASANNIACAIQDIKNFIQK